MGWMNPYTEWKPDDFCGITFLNIPAETLWKPDIIIAEKIERSKDPSSPYLNIRFYGRVIWWNEEVIITSCKMHIYKFPFDTQSCSITFKSVTHTDAQLQISTVTDNKHVTWLSEMSIQTEYEWLFINMNISQKTVQYPRSQTLHVFTITMKRRAALYIANFLLPILFFLCLDSASFLISDTGGEKLSFKITVLLAVTVMQLLLNDILPGSSNRIPLISIFCIGIFSLMLLSVLETIVVKNLIDRDVSSQEKKTDEEQNLKKKRGSS
ncbi:5-hydroxytryptamine receptor 3A-like [Kryptolebias marmoratus]|uniref:5-hydroxytryptamine receptor 3A-like n=1 Tax=Kryptolebias marmoratus TaxID=37003 RepID=UPI0018ACB290|nr:5-hydroxytryptamine receptor 3A-like [Kryptolebias marmoratus]